MIRLEEYPIKCAEETCDRMPVVRLVVYRPDLIGNEDKQYCREHFYAVRDAYRAHGKKHGQEVVEEHFA